MRRIKERRWGRNEAAVNSSGATHVIKIGQTVKSKEGKNIPGKLAGFLICRDTLDEKNQFIVDYDAMKRLGYSREQVEKARQIGFKADAGLLPQELHFVLMNDAVRGEDGCWEYPNFFSQAYECYTTQGRFCWGNGEEAIRKQADGSTKTIACVPVGKRNAPSSTYCEHSGRFPDGKSKPCHLHMRITLCLLCKENSKLVALAQSLGMQARFRLDTTSEYCAMEIESVLDPVTEELDGHIQEVTGTITFQKRGRRTGTGKEIVGHIYFQLHRESIEAKKARLYDDQVRQYRLQHMGQAVVRQLEGPKSAIETEAEEELAGVPFEDPKEVPQDAPEAAATPATAPAGGQPVEAPPQAAPEPPAAQEAAPALPTQPLKTSDLETLMAQEPPVQVAERIHDHALAIAERDGANYTDTLNDVCFGSPDGLYNAKKKTFTRIATADEFLRGDSERQRIQRLKMLYEIGLRIAIDGDPAAEPDEPPDLFEGGEKGVGK